MDRRRFLQASVAALSLAGAAVVGLVFVQALSPTESMISDNTIFFVGDLDSNDEKTIEMRGIPVVIQRIDGKLRAFELLARYSTSDATSCLIKRIEAPTEHMPPETVFRESCRGVNYDANGQVLRWSDPRALPMRKYVLESVGPDRIRIIDWDA